MIIKRPTLSMAASMTKSEILLELMRLGEFPPKTWSKLECAMRLEELRAEKGVKHIGIRHRRTALQDALVKLNVASQKKGTLVELAKSLGVVVEHSDTIAVLQKRVYNHIYQTTPASAEDPVGFGEHSALTYEEVSKRQDYRTWVVTTYQEYLGDPEHHSCSTRLMRLAKWLLDQSSSTSSTDTEMIPEAGVMTKARLAELGYLRKGKKKVSDGLSRTSNGSETESFSPSGEQVTKLMEELKGLRKEVETLKAQGSSCPSERPHKSRGTVESFEVVNPSS